jgi:hypothetical protein
VLRGTDNCELDESVIISEATSLDAAWSLVRAQIELKNKECKTGEHLPLASFQRCAGSGAMRRLGYSHAIFDQPDAQSRWHVAAIAAAGSFVYYVFNDVSACHLR